MTRSNLPEQIKYQIKYIQQKQRMGSLRDGKQMKETWVFSICYLERISRLQQREGELKQSLAVSVS